MVFAGLTQLTLACGNEYLLGITDLPLLSHFWPSCFYPVCSNVNICVEHELAYRERDGDGEACLWTDTLLFA